MNNDNINPADYGIDSDAITRQAIENLKANRHYQKLYEELQRLDSRLDFVKRNYVLTQIREMESKEINRLVNLELDRRKDVNRLTDYLQGDDRNRYQELMTGLSLLLDMIDSTFFNINQLLKRCNSGIQMENFPEMVAAKKLAWTLANGEQNDMPRYKADLWSEESERLYASLQKRCAVFRRKVERKEAKIDARTESSDRNPPRPQVKVERIEAKQDHP